MRKSPIQQIVDKQLCLGCGLCEAVCGKKSVEMKLQSDGFFLPVIKSAPSVEKEKIIAYICPGVNVTNDLLFDDHDSVWGKKEKLYAGFSTDDEIRKRGSSGGIISGVAVYVLDNKLVDAVLQVGGNQDDYERNTLRISRTREDVLACASSRYAPALIFDRILEILAETSDRYCFIGKPCDISALKNFLTVYPQYKARFVLTVSIMCAGMPSFAGTKAIVDKLGAVPPVKDLVYRGNGWPGYFSFTDMSKQKFQMTYNDSWGKVLNRYLNFRCKICPDGIGLQADMAVGDAWETNDGYPDFAEKEGKSLVIVRTAVALKLMQDAEKSADVVVEEIPEDKLAIMQPYQYSRRTKVGARLLAFFLIKRSMVRFRGMYVYRNMRKVALKSLMKEFIGTSKRLVRAKS
jgi:coenzyme F420 hydrogenase subunit beta